MKTKYTKELAESLAKLISEGCTYKEAYQKMNIGHNSFFTYLNKYKEFEELIKKAVQERDKLIETEAVKCIKTAIDKGTWQAAAWWLERTNPDKYAVKNKKVEEGINEVKLVING